MSLQFNIFISHDSQDEVIAIELKTFLEGIFLNANIYVSGRDLEGGQTWIENIKLSLRSSQVIISLISKKSIDNKWIYFETGAGFIEDKAIPLITDGLQFNDLMPPLNQLQARTLSKVGIESLVQDIASKLNLRKPSHLSAIEKLLSETEKFLNLRNTEEDTIIYSEERPKAHVNEDSRDSKVLEEHSKSLKRLNELMIKKLLSVKNELDIPSEEEFMRYTSSELSECLNAYNLETPTTARINLMMVNLDFPKQNDKQWKKMNAFKNIEEANSLLDKYEKSIAYN